MECDAPVLAQGGVEILERLEEHEHERIAEATRGQRGHWVLATEVLEHSCEPGLHLSAVNPLAGHLYERRHRHCGSHLPGIEGGILKDTSMILLAPQHQVFPAPRKFASCCFMHATAVRSTNQQPPDRARARDMAQNRVP